MPNDSPTAAKIVIVEDDITLADMYKISLGSNGYTVIVANDGLAGLDVIRTHMPDLVLLDLMLPELSGVDVLARMRASDWGRDIKVIIMTNISENEAPDGLSKLKFEKYIVKANQGLNEIAKIINTTLASDQSQAPTA